MNNTLDFGRNNVTLWNCFKTVQVYRTILFSTYQSWPCFLQKTDIEYHSLQDQLVKTFESLLDVAVLWLIYLTQYSILDSNLIRINN
jgi:hypothetical protein